jgi:hypothetical protein
MNKQELEAFQKKMDSINIDSDWLEEMEGR